MIFSDSDPGMGRDLLIVAPPHNKTISFFSYKSIIDMSFPISVDVMN